MNTTVVASAEAPARQERAAFVLLLFIFFVSGAAALIYQVVWTRRLFLTLGATSLAISTILTAFMSGLAIGSLYAGRWIDRGGRPLRLYAWLELAIAIYGLLTPALFNGIEWIYYGLAGWIDLGLWPSLIVRFLLSMAILIVPTTLMGATLPILSKHVTTHLGHFGRRIGLLYGLNTFGAAAGTVLTGFLVIQLFGISGTIWFAAALNLFVALFALGLERAERPAEAAPSPTPAVAPPPAASEPPPLRLTPTEHRCVLLIAALGGFSTFVYEIAWTRVLTLVLGGAVQAFSIMLTTFLVGLALGSFVLSRWIDRSRDLFRFYAIIEGLVAVTTLALLPWFGDLPFFYLRFFPSFADSYTLLTLFAFFICFLMMIVPTFLIGVTFPVVSKLYARDIQSLGRRIGEVYFANTVGGIFGSFAGGFVLIPLLGMEMACIVAALINAASAILAALLGTSAAPRRIGLAAAVAGAMAWLLIGYPAWWRPVIVEHPLVAAVAQPQADWRKPGQQPCGRCSALVWTHESLRVAVRAEAGVVLCTGCAALDREERGLAQQRFWDPRIITTGIHVYAKRYAARPDGAILRDAIKGLRLRFYEEGLNAVVTVKSPTNIPSLRALQINGKTDASNSDDFATESLCSAIPLMLHPDPKDVLVIGIGSGISVGTATRFPSVRSIDTLEIEEAVLNGARLFGPDNYGVFGDPAQGIPPNPKVHVEINDGRHFCAITPRRYDVVVSQPSNPWMSGPSHLFTVEHFRNLRRVVKDDGVALAWVQTYSITPFVVFSVIKTFRSVFEHTMLIGYARDPGDFFLIGSRQPFAFDVERMRQRYNDPGIRHDLERVGYPTPADLLAALVLRREDLDRYLGLGPEGVPDFAEVLKAVPLNTDDFPYVEFEAPRHLHEEDSPREVIGALLRFRRNPWPPLVPFDDATLKALDLCPRLARNSEATGLTAAALHVAERGVAVNPADDRLRTQLIGLLTQKWQSQRTPELQQQLHEQLETLAAHEPDRAFAWHHLGRLELAEKRFDAAATHFAKAVATGNAGAETHADLGYALAELGRWEEARQSLEKAVALRPDSSAAHEGLVRTLDRLGGGEPLIRALQHWLDAEGNLATRMRVRDRLQALREGQ